MIGLIKKDILLIVKNFSIVYLFTFVIVIVPIMQNPIFMLPIISLMVSLLLAAQVLITITHDESVNWGRSVSAMPINPSEEVGSKYLLALFLAIISTIIASLIGFVLYNFISLEKELVTFYVFLSFCVGLLYNSIIIPAALKFGSSKCRFVLLIFVTIPTIVAFILKSMNINVPYEKLHLGIFEMILFFLIITLIFMGGSYFISIKIKRNKV